MATPAAIEFLNRTTGEMVTAKGKDAIPLLQDPETWLRWTGASDAERLEVLDAIAAPSTPEPEVVAEPTPVPARRRGRPRRAAEE